MKKFLFVILSFFIATQAHSQPDLNIVWQKNLAPWGAVDFAKIAPDGSKIYIASYNTIWKIDTKTGELDTVPFDKKGTAGIYYMDISQKGNYIVTKDGGTAVNIWDVQKEKSIKYIPDAGYPTMTPDEKYVIIAGYNKIIIYSMELDSIIKQIPINGIAYRTKTSHDGKYFVSGSQYYDKNNNKAYDQLILWDAINWKLIDTLETIAGSGGSSYSLLKFSWDDKYLGFMSGRSSDAFSYDLKTKILQTLSDINQDCGTIEFLPDNLTYLSSYAPPPIIYRSNIIGNKILQNFNFYADLIEASDTLNNTFYIFTSLRTDLTLLKGGLVSNINDDYKGKINIIINKGDLYLSSLESANLNLQLNINDSIGRIVYQEVIPELHSNDRYKLNVQLISGSYFCKLKYGGKEYVQQIIVTR